MEQEDKDQDVLAIWQTCVEMANGVSQRRDTMNNLFVTLNRRYCGCFLDVGC